MPEPRRIVVLVVRHDTSTPAPNLADVRRLMLTGPHSVARYWRDNAENWFSFDAFDFFGPYDVMLPPPPASRREVRDRARAAAVAAGVNLDGYDSTVVIASPGAAGGKGYDVGATGIGPDNAAVLPSSGDFTYYCHEVGHVLGFNHSYGIPTTGGDWSDDGIDQLHPVYGDPYDIMSSAAFGGAQPTFQLPESDAIPGFAASRNAGPMLARAQLHFYRPAAMEATGKVRHVYENGNDEVVTLYPAGSGAAGAELIAYHPAGEDDRARGRVYVEYRHRFDFNAGSRWDEGLAAAGKARDRSGVIVHVVRDVPEGDQTAVWYAGRVVFPSPDCDVVVETPRGAATVTVSDEFMQDGNPAFVRVRVSRATRPRLSVREASSDAVEATESERRVDPEYPWAGEFSWERRSTTRTTTYVPVASGLGGASPIDAASAVTVRWLVDGAELAAGAGVLTFTPAGAGREVRLTHDLNAETGRLTLTNTPADGSFSATVVARASAGAGASASVTTTFSVDGMSEGWGPDHQRFLDFWDRITHPIPKQRFGPVKLGPDDRRDAFGKFQLGLTLQAFDQLRQANPAVAARVTPMIIDQQRLVDMPQALRE